ncbi:VOC family protein [Gordonia sp. (in: high G+C Gram-positive bacteria)]|uniref:VOC family protein n=1 Tax=Gordonia sp. (in: high G+C Gram-positive bacteria) TaxID=84139 RepID=UPI0035275B22
MTTRIDHSIWPGIPCDDPLTVRDWLTRLGFVPGILVEGDGDRQVHHSEMLWPEGGRVMIHSAAPDLPATRGSGNVYVVVDDPDAVYARAVELGATLVRDLKDEDYGSRGFTVADAEGNAWSFGTYAG